MVAIWGFQCQATHCLKVFKVPHEEGDAVILENLVEEGTCLNCGGDLRIILVPPAGTVVYEEISAKDFWNKLNGLGSVNEEIRGSVGIEMVRFRLLNDRVVEVQLAETDTGRCAVHSLTVFTGARNYKLYFAVGSGEAVIYKITEE